MPILNIEIKARLSDADVAREYLRSQRAMFLGTDRQIDTYFHAPNGRLKLREGNIEMALIFYQRADQQGPKRSDVHLYRLADATECLALKETLESSLGIKAVVDKKREIYYIGNVKFHLDVVEGLGEFLEIEAIDKSGVMTEGALRQQCSDYMKALGVQEEDLLSLSYSDMISPQ